MSVSFQCTWTCDRCKTALIQPAEETSPYDDPAVAPPEGWDYASDGNTYCCPKCLTDEARGAP